MTRSYRFKFIIMPGFQSPMPFLPVKIGTDDRLRRLLVSQRFNGTCIPESWAESLGLEIRKIEPTPADMLESVYVDGMSTASISLYDDKGRKAGEHELNLFISKDLNANDYGVFGNSDQLRLWSCFKIDSRKAGAPYGEFKMKRPGFSILSIFK